MKAATVIEVVLYTLTLNVRLKDGYALNQDTRVVTYCAKSPEAFTVAQKSSIELISSVTFFSKVTFYTVTARTG